MNFGKDSNSYECRRLLLETTYDVRFNYKDALSQVIEDMTTLSESFGASICIDKNSIMDKEMFESFFQKILEMYYLFMDWKHKEMGFGQ